MTTPHPGDDDLFIQILAPLTLHQIEDANTTSAPVRYGDLLPAEWLWVTPWIHSCYGARDVASTGCSAAGSNSTPSANPETDWPGASAEQKSYFLGDSQLSIG